MRLLRRWRRSGSRDPERVEFAAEALELRALGVDELGWGLGDEALVREHALGAGDLLAQALSLGLDVAVRLRPLGLDHRVEDALLVPLERDEDAAPPEGR